MSEVVVGQVYADLGRPEGRPDRELQVTKLHTDGRFVEVVVIGRTGGVSAACTCNSRKPGHHNYMMGCPAWGVGVGRHAVFEKRLLGNKWHPLLREPTTVDGTGTQLTNPTTPG